MDWMRARKEGQQAPWFSEFQAQVTSWLKVPC